MIDCYRRFLEGDDKSLEEIIHTYKDGLILYLNGYVHNLVLAEELTEETFVKLVLKHPVFFKRSAFKTWLYAIARNIALDHLRKRKHITALLTDCENLADEDEDLEKKYLYQEQKIQLHDTIKKLKPEYRQVLWLVYFEGFSHKETARILGTTVYNAETLAYRARQALKTKLLEEGFEYENL